MDLNQILPYKEETLELVLDAVKSVDEVVEWMTINGKSATLTALGKIQWIVNQLDDDGNEKTDADGNVLTCVIDTEAWEGYKGTIRLNIPIDTIITELKWTEPSLESLNVKWIVDYNTGEKYLPITHIDAVIDAEGNKLSSLINNIYDLNGDRDVRIQRLEDKLLEEVTTSHTGESRLCSDGTYRCIDPITLYGGDRITIAGHTDFTCSLIDTSGNVIVAPSNDEIIYEADEDVTLYIQTSSAQTAVGYELKQIQAHVGSAGGSGVSFFNGTHKLTISDTVTGNSYDVMTSLDDHEVKKDNLSYEVIRLLDKIDQLESEMRRLHDDEVVNVSVDPVKSGFLQTINSDYDGDQSVVLTNITLSKDSTALEPNSGVLKVNGTTLASGFNVNNVCALPTNTILAMTEGNTYTITLEYKDAEGSEFSIDLQQIKCWKAGAPYFIGTYDGKAADFTAMTGAELRTNATQYTHEEEVDTVVNKWIYYVMIPTDLTFDSFGFTKDGTTFTCDINDFNCTHAQVAYNSVNYNVYGYRSEKNNLTFTLKVHR